MTGGKATSLDHIVSDPSHEVRNTAVGDCTVYWCISEKYCTHENLGIGLTGYYLRSYFVSLARPNCSVPSSLICEMVESISDIRRAKVALNS